MSRLGAGRHRQSWIMISCPRCALSCRARRTLPGHAMHIRTHFDPDGELCPPAILGETRFVFVDRADPDQLSLDFG